MQKRGRTPPPNASLPPRAATVHRLERDVTSRLIPQPHCTLWGNSAQVVTAAFGETAGAIFEREVHWTLSRNIPSTTLVGDRAAAGLDENNERDRHQNYFVIATAPALENSSLYIYQPIVHRDAILPTAASAQRMRMSLFFIRRAKHLHLWRPTDSATATA